jgi:hypothetical protein
MSGALAPNFPLGQLVAGEPFKTENFEARLFRPFSPRPLMYTSRGPAPADREVAIEYEPRPVEHQTAKTRHEFNSAFEPLMSFCAASSQAASHCQFVVSCRTVDSLGPIAWSIHNMILRRRSERDASSCESRLDVGGASIHCGIRDVSHGRA